MASIPDSTDGNWLQVYMEDSAGRNLCTNFHCGTCGASEFRQGLLTALSRASGRELVTQVRRMDGESAYAVACVLASVRPPVGEGPRFEGVAMGILDELWHTFPYSKESSLKTILRGTWAGEVLARMMEHEEAVEAWWRAYEESQRPEEIQRRRDEKKRLKQEQHAVRLAEQAVRSRLWHEKHKSGDTT